MAGTTPKNNQDFLAQRVDSLGNIIWVKSYGGSNIDIGTCIIKTSIDSGYAMVGYTTSFGATVSDILLIKLDKNGNILWSQIYGN